MPPFHLFGLSHCLTLLTIAALAAILIILHKRSNSGTQRKLEITLAICCLLSYPFQLLSAWIGGYNLSMETKVPLHLCDLAAIIGGISILKKSQKLFGLTYFWGLAGTLQGLLTPNIVYGFPSLQFLNFFWNHGFIVITAVFIPLALTWRARRKAIWFVFGMTQVYVAGAMCANALLGTNYGFLHHKPETTSVLDYFPDWPWYILILEFVCLTLFFLLYLPVQERKNKIS